MKKNFAEVTMKKTSPAKAAKRKTQPMKKMQVMKKTKAMKSKKHPWGKAPRRQRRKLRKERSKRTKNQIRKFKNAFQMVGFSINTTPFHLIQITMKNQVENLYNNWQFFVFFEKLSSTNCDDVLHVSGSETLGGGFRTPPPPPPNNLQSTKLNHGLKMKDLTKDQFKPPPPIKNTYHWPS